MDDKANFAAALPAVGGARVSSPSGETASPEPPPMLGLTADEKGLYNHICETLRQAGIEHDCCGSVVAAHDLGIGERRPRKPFGRRMRERLPQISDRLLGVMVA